MSSAVPGWRKLDRNVLWKSIEESDLLQHPFDNAAADNVEQLFMKYDTTHWALSTSWRRCTPYEDIRVGWGADVMVWCWMSSRKIMECRRLERWHRRTGDSRDRRVWDNETRSLFRLHRRRKRKPRVVWMITNQNVEYCGSASWSRSRHRLRRDSHSKWNHVFLHTEDWEDVIKHWRTDINSHLWSTTEFSNGTTSVGYV